MIRNKVKTIYFVRHSKPIDLNNNYNNESLQEKNEKRILSVEGEQIAFNWFNHDEFDNIKEVFSSNYVRAIGTAKYLAEKNNTKIVIVPDFGERKIGIDTWDEYPSDFEIHQFNDNDYKLENGESLNEVRERELKALINILNSSKSNRIAIVFHSTAMMTLLKTWCEVSYDSNYYFKGNKFFDGKWNYCETFKLVFDENSDLVSIENIR